MTLTTWKLPPEIRQENRRFLIKAIAGAAAAVAVGIAIPVSVVFLTAPDKQARQACDAVVHTLLTTRDPLELQRTAILVHEMSCDVARRAAPFLQEQISTMRPGS